MSKRFVEYYVYSRNLVNDVLFASSKRLALQRKFYQILRKGRYMINMDLRAFKAKVEVVSHQAIFSICSSVAEEDEGHLDLRKGRILCTVSRRH
jgi:hypothetical protein